MNKIIENFKNPRNYGKMENPDCEGSYGNEICGDFIKVFLKLEKNIIKSAKFEGAGCSVSIASASILTEKIKGKTLKEIEAMDWEKFIKKELGELNRSRQYCAMICVKALKDAIKDNQEL